MIKFFRKIRQQLAYENNVTKYMRYAIGEIVLVVIGILIALSINNWNGERNEKNLIAEILNEIKEDLGADTLGFNDGIERYEWAIKVKKWGLNRIEYTVNQKDSIFMYLFPNTFDYVIVTKGFERLKNSDLHNYYQFKNVIKAINQYYTVEMNRYDRIIDWDIAYNESFTDWAQDRQMKFELHFYDFPSVQSESDNLTYLLSEIKSPPFRAMMESRYHRRNSIVELLKDMKGKSIQLIDEIDHSIK